jgi:propionyl-CoA carboxylase alpha chain
LTEKSFVSGDISTNYLSEVYPDGFKGRKLSNTDKHHIMAIAACVYSKMDIRSYTFLNERPSTAKHKEPADWTLIISLFAEELQCDVKKVGNEFRVSSSSAHLCTCINFLLVIRELPPADTVLEVSNLPFYYKSYS